MTLIELIASMVIITVAMAGCYFALTFFGRHLSFPEEILKSINTVEYYQARILDLRIPEDCHQESDLKALMDVWCQNDSKEVKVQIPVDKTIWQGEPQTIFFMATPFKDYKNLLQVHMRLMKREKNLFETRFFMEQP